MAEEKKTNGNEKEPDSWFIWEGKRLEESEFCQAILDQVTNHPVVKNEHGKWKEIIEWTDKGNQFETWNAGHNRMAPVELVRRKKRVVINLMKPLSEAIESKLNLYYKVAGQPNSDEQKDIYGAEVAGKLIDYNDYTIGIEEIMEDVKYDMTRTGQGCVRALWDPSYPARGRVKKEGKDVQVDGEVLLEHVPIFNIRPDPLARSPKSMRWMIVVTETTKQELRDKFLKYDRLTEEDIDKAVEEDEKEKAARHKDETTSSGLTIKEFIEVSSSDYKSGRHIFVFNGKAIYVGPNKNPGAEVGFFFFPYKKNPYSFWATGPMFYVQPVQREFNRTVSLISEHIEAWRPKMAVGQGALKRAGSMTVDSFEIVEVDFSRGEPRPINMPELSGQVLAYRDFLISSVDRVSNVHEVSYSRLPQYASRAPASLYAMMIEQENLKLDPMIARLNKTVLDMCRFRLKLMDKHYTDFRMVKIVGENRKASVAYFNKSDLNENYDVRLEIGVSLRQSTTIQQRLLIELWDKNIIEQTPRNRNKINQWLNLGTAEQAFRTDTADIEKAMRENQAFVNKAYDKPRKEGGVLWLIDDDHEVHIEAHVTLLKSEEAAAWDDKDFEALIEHINQHREFYLMAQAASAQTAMPGEQTPMAGPQTVEGGEPMIENAAGLEPGEI